MPASTAIASGTYTLDTARSTIGVSHKAMWGLATVNGAFTAQSGDAKIRNGATAAGAVTIAEATSDAVTLSRQFEVDRTEFGLN